MAFVADQQAQGRAVESICRVLREQGCQVAARTYREWKSPSRPLAARTVVDAQVHNAVRDAAWTTGPDGVRRLAPEGLYGRRKMTAVLPSHSRPGCERRGGGPGDARPRAGRGAPPQPSCPVS